MDNIIFNYDSKRSQKSRIGVRFSHSWLVVLSTLMILSFVIGATLVALGIPLGWTLIGFSFVPSMIVEWYEGELKNQKCANNPSTIDDILDSSILGRLPKNPTPKNLIQILAGDTGGQFMMVRMGISTSFLNELASNDRNDMQQVWDEAWNITKTLGGQYISGPILIVSLIKQTPNYKTLINHLQLDDDDLVNGIKWFDHLSGIITKQNQSRKFGGFARDWAFGFTPLLNRFAINVSQQIGKSGLALIELETHKSALNQLEKIFSKPTKQNVILVGGDGAGKSEIVRAFAAKLLDAESELPDTVKFSQIFMLDAAALMSAASGRGELELLIPRILREVYNAKNVILFLDNAQLFFEENIGSVDLTNIIQPVLESGNLRIIMSMSDQQYLRVAKRNPSLENNINKIIVDSASETETMLIIQDKVIVVEMQNSVTFMYQAIKEAYRLSDRYVHDLVMPGKALQLIEAAARFANNGLVTVQSVDDAIEKSLGVKIGSINSQIERSELLNMESLIHNRMVNQKRAVTVVCDAIRRSRAGVRNQNRPVGTFLFLGPTGVGKTELAKSLSEVYFGGEDHLIRIDMNEYSNGSDCDRLIADGADNPHSLAAQVMKMPFCVILLDEIEKANSSVLLMLLQMLDEGVLRDINNREVNFRDAIIIATSNAGSNKIREYIDRGYDLEKFERQFIDDLVSSKRFQPEFLNRFDEIVMFRPLDKSELLQVIDKMIANVNKTLSVNKINVAVDKNAREYLVESGNDPKLGARPMQRIVQKAVENIIANKIISGEIESGGDITITLDQVKQMIDSKNSAQNLIDNK